MFHPLVAEAVHHANGGRSPLDELRVLFPGSRVFKADPSSSANFSEKLAMYPSFFKVPVKIPIIPRFVHLR